MGIDSGYGIGSLKTGVCTSTTRPAVPFEGQTIYETDTDLTKVYNGTAFVNVSALVRVGGGTLSGSATTFSNVFSSTYDAYKIVITNAAFSGNSYAYMTLGSTATGYVNYNFGVLTNGTASNGFGGQGTTYWAPFFIQSVDYGATVDLINPNLAKRTYITGGLGIDAANSIGGIHMGSLNNTTQYTAFTLTQNSGTATGTVNIYGYALSQGMT